MSHADDEMHDAVNRALANSNHPEQPEPESTPTIETHAEPGEEGPAFEPMSEIEARAMAPEPIHIAFLNQSTVVSEADFTKWVIACAEQARTHAAPLWGWPTPVVEFLPDETFIRPEHDLIYLFDDADQAGALGYHDVTPAGQPYAKVFAKTCMENGASVSACMSHETLELLGDPTADVWASAPDGFEYALELCDAVQDFSYHLGDVEVSDFVVPAFFGVKFDGRPGRYDYLSKLTAAFQTGAGGYQIQRDPKTGSVTQVFGFGHFKEWLLRAKRHVAARTFKRGVR